MFATVLHELKSPQNVGSIVRTHVAMGGGPLVMVGQERPWQFRKSTQAFSRKLERQCDIVYLDDDAAFFEWCEGLGFAPVAVEIRPQAAELGSIEWPERPALVFGNERTGLTDGFVRRCEQVVRIPQFGAVGSLNVAIAHGMVAFDVRRGGGDALMATGRKYPETRPRSR